MPPPVADRSIVGALRIWLAPSVIPPVPATRFNAVAAPMLPVTPMVPELMETLVAPVTGPATPTLPVLTSVKSPVAIWMLPSEPIALAFVSDAPRAEESDSVFATIDPPDWPIVPAEMRVTVLPPADTLAPRVRSPVVVFSARLPVELTTPVVVSA